MECSKYGPQAHLLQEKKEGSGGSRQIVTFLQNAYECSKETPGRLLVNHFTNYRAH